MDDGERRNIVSADDDGRPTPPSRNRLVPSLYVCLVVVIVAEIVVAFVYEEKDSSRSDDMQSRAQAATALIVSTLLAVVASSLLLCVARFCEDPNCRTFDNPGCVGFYMVTCAVAVVGAVIMPLTAAILFSINASKESGGNVVLVGFSAALAFLISAMSFVLYAFFFRQFYAERSSE